MEEKTERRPHAHPMPGWVAIMPMEMLAEPGQHVHRPLIQGPDFLAGILAQVTPDIEAGLVMEIGTLPSHVDQDEVIPYHVNSTVFWAGDNGIKIGEYVYLQCQSVIAWDDPPDDN